MTFVTMPPSLPVENRILTTFEVFHLFFKAWDSLHN